MDTASAYEATNSIVGESVPANSVGKKKVVNPPSPPKVLGTTPKSGRVETERAQDLYSAWKTGSILPL